MKNKNHIAMSIINYNEKTNLFLTIVVKSSLIV